MRESKSLLSHWRQRTFHTSESRWILKRSNSSAKNKAFPTTARLALIWQSAKPSKTNASADAARLFGFTCLLWRARTRDLAEKTCLLARAQAHRFSSVLALHEVPRAMDHYFSGCLPEEKFPHSHLVCRVGSNNAFKLPSVSFPEPGRVMLLEEESPAYEDGSARPAH